VSNTLPRTLGLSLRPGRPTGPRSDRGKRAASQNALKHGLSRPLDSTAWGEFFEPLTAHLMAAEGLPRSAARALAGQILEFERNLAFQREALLGLRPYQKALTRFEEGSSARAARMERALETGAFEEVSERELRSAARFFRRLGRGEHRRNLKVEGEGLRLELRYFKAAANGLFKGLKDVVALPIVE